MRSQVYEVRVRGQLTPELLREIGALDVHEESPLTVLRTVPTDQSGLHGTLQRLRSLGLELVEVRQAGGLDVGELPAPEPPVPDPPVESSTP